MTGCMAEWPYSMEDSIDFCRVAKKKKKRIIMKMNGDFVGIISLVINPLNNERKCSGYFGYWAAESIEDMVTFTKD